MSQIAEYLAGVPEIEALAQLQVGLRSSETRGLAELEESLTEVIEALGPAATIGELTHLSGLLRSWKRSSTNSWACCLANRSVAKRRKKSRKRYRRSTSTSS